MEDLVIHVYTESEYTKPDSQAVHTLGQTDQKLELLVGINNIIILLI
jgi:hypothetical protein